jgi:hypothetical protein
VPNGNTTAARQTGKPRGLADSCIPGLRVNAAADADHLADTQRYARSRRHGDAIAQWGDVDVSTHRNLDADTDRNAHSDNTAAHCHARAADGYLDARTISDGDTAT